jgi:hypothetical protein
MRRNRLIGWGIAVLAVVRQGPLRETRGYPPGHGRKASGQWTLGGGPLLGKTVCTGLALAAADRGSTNPATFSGPEFG